MIARNSKRTALKYPTKKALKLNRLIVGRGKEIKFGCNRK